MSERLIPIDEILNKVHASLSRQLRTDPFNHGTNDAVRWVQDLVYFSMTSSEIYDEILIVAKETIEED